MDDDDIEYRIKMNRSGEYEVIRTDHETNEVQSVYTHDLWDS
ncbi:hypothetical protein [Spirillospora sp. NPDC047279]